MIDERVHGDPQKIFENFANRQLPIDISSVSPFAICDCVEGVSPFAICDCVESVSPLEIRNTAEGVSSLEIRNYAKSEAPLEAWIRARQAARGGFPGQ